MFVLGEGVIEMRLRIWIVDDLCDRYLRGRCAFVCLSTMSERYFVRGIGGMSDVNDLIDEKTKMKMRDGIVFVNSFLFFFQFVLHLHTPPSTHNLLYPSHDVYPDDYGSDCVDNDCC